MENSSKFSFAILILIFSTCAVSSCSSTKNTHRTQNDPYASKQDSLILYQGPHQQFQFRYPPVFLIVHESIANTNDWSRISSSISKGDIVVRLKTNPIFQANTNLNEATFTVGRSNDHMQLKKCLQKQSDGYVAVADSIMKGGRTYFKTVNGGAAGPKYSLTIQYRTPYKGYCYSIEQRVFSTGISYMEPEKRPAVFDSAKVWGVLDTAWQSFHFTQ